jgi:glutamyl-tRNA reductase
VIDLAIPPDVDPEDACTAGIERVGMDEIITEAERLRREQLVEAADARACIDDAVAAFRSRLAEWSLGPAFAAVQQHYRDAAIESAEKALRRELRGLGEKEQAAVRLWAEALARRLAHLPTAGIRGLAHEHGIPAVETFLSTAAPALALSMRQNGQSEGHGGAATGSAEKGSLHGSGS